MADEAISLFGKLAEREGFRDGKGRIIKGRFTLEFSAPDLVFNADENQIAGVAATAIADTIKTNMLAGMTPSGAPLPAASAATVRRREYRDKQASNNGNVSSRYRNKRFRTRAYRTYRRRFKFAGGEFSPAKYDNTLIGRESGLLASSAKAVPEGGRWVVFFAANRGNVDRTGKSAVHRVFSRIQMWSDDAWRQPRIQRALNDMKRSLITVRGAKLGSQLMETMRRLQSIGQAAQDTANAESDE
jgi:hypothetical protein